MRKNLNSRSPVGFAELIWKSLRRQLHNNFVASTLYHAWKKRQSRWRFMRELSRFETLSGANGRLPLRREDLFPCLMDNTGTTHIDRHYVYHTAWAARVLARTRPQEHVDISSYVFFSTIVSAFVPIRFYDYRPAHLGLDSLESEFADLTCLPFETKSLASVSCMHVIEHVGLGRYGDEIDPDGDLKAISELKRVLAPGGQLLFVVPVGEPRIEFNAHRIYGYEQVIHYFSDLELKEFALIPDSADQGGLLLNASPSVVANLRYGCGCFLFRSSIE